HRGGDILDDEERRNAGNVGFSHVSVLCRFPECSARPAGRPCCVIDTIDISYYTSPMAMGKRKRDRQPTMWVTTTDLPTAASHPFYRRLNQLCCASTGSTSSSSRSAPAFMRRRWVGRDCRRGSIFGCCLSAISRALTRS